MKPGTDLANMIEELEVRCKHNADDMRMRLGENPSPGPPAAHSNMTAPDSNTSNTNSAPTQACAANSEEKEEEEEEEEEMEDEKEGEEKQHPTQRTTPSLHKHASTCVSSIAPPAPTFCAWQGKHCDLQRHLNNDCPFEPAKCKVYNCGLVRRRMYLQEHEEACGKREIWCGVCETRVLARDMNTHVNKCPNETVKCDACGSVMKRAIMEEHKNTCEEMDVACEFADVGCGVRMKRQKHLLESHAKWSMLKHQRMMVDDMRKMREQMKRDREQEIEYIRKEREQMRAECEAKRKKEEQQWAKQREEMRRECDTKVEQMRRDLEVMKEGIFSLKAKGDGLREDIERMREKQREKEQEKSIKELDHIVKRTHALTTRISENMLAQTRRIAEDLGVRFAWSLSVRELRGPPVSNPGETRCVSESSTALATHHHPHHVHPHQEQDQQQQQHNKQYEELNHQHQQEQQRQQESNQQEQPQQTQQQTCQRIFYGTKRTDQTNTDWGVDMSNTTNIQTQGGNIDMISIGVFVFPEHYNKIAWNHRIKQKPADKEKRVYIRWRARSGQAERAREFTHAFSEAGDWFGCGDMISRDKDLSKLSAEDTIDFEVMVI